MGYTIISVLIFEYLVICTLRIYAYLRASTKEQDASRAKLAISEFCHKNNLNISAWFYETESGTSLKRPELFNLLRIANKGDTLLVEQVDRLSRLTSDDWKKLKSLIDAKGIRIVSLDLPTSHDLLGTKDEFTEWMLRSINSMMLDMLAAISRKDYEDRLRRQKEGIARAVKSKKYKGRPRDDKLRKSIRALLKDNRSYGEIVEITGCSRSTISSVKKDMATDNDQ